MEHCPKACFSYVQSKRKILVLENVQAQCGRHTATPEQKAEAISQLLYCLCADRKAGSTVAEGASPGNVLYDHQLRMSLTRCGVQMDMIRRAELFQLSVKLGETGDSWRLAEVVRLHEKGRTDEVECCRLVSLLALVLKIMQRIIRDAIAKCFCVDGVLETQQQHQWVVLPHRLAIILGPGNSKT